MRFALAIFSASLLLSFSFSLEAAPPTDDPRWAQAQMAYEGGRDDEGHNLLVALAEENPGDLDLAVACYRTIMTEEGRIGTSNPWIDLASSRLVSLERLGGISANSSIVRKAADTVVESGLRDGKHLQVKETIDRLYQRNRHDLYWRMRRASTYASMDLADTRALYLGLKGDMDLDHPDLVTRDYWFTVQKELSSFDNLPRTIFPLPEGSLLLNANPDDPEGRWRAALDRLPSSNAEGLDRLHGHAATGLEVIPWIDLSGVTDPLRALDQHLRSKPKRELRALRKVQDENLSRETISSAPTTAELLALTRRYPWSLSAQKLLLKLGNEALWEGRADSALRSFEELLDHTLWPSVKDAASVGYWTALRMAGEIETLKKTADTIDPDKVYPWMAGKATGAIIRKTLLEGVVTPEAPTAPTLASMQQHILRLPPVAPWPTDTPSVGFGIDLQVISNQVIASGRNLLVSYDATDPARVLWSQLQRAPIEENRKTGYHPGYFRPLFTADTIFTRWGLTSLPEGLAAFRLRDGRPLWSSVPNRLRQERRKPKRRFAVPMGDPVAADGMLFYLEWSTENDVNDRRGRSVNLVCFDPHSRKARWSTPIATAGRRLDIGANFDNASPQTALYGNAVTIHQGAVYCNTNAGFIARCDVRDGKMDWIHYYRRTRGDLAPENLGSAPLLYADLLICMPRDGGRVFALDRASGLIVWDNPLVLATEALGIVDDTLIVRGVGTLAGLDLKTGKARWYRPLPARVLGRSQLIGSSVYLGEIDHLARLDAHSGTPLEKLNWELGEDRPLGFAIAGSQLYVVSDRPTADPREQVAQLLDGDPPAQAAPFAFPLQRAWTLSRSDARIALPPLETGLRNTAFLLSGGILECLDLGPRGDVRWRRFVDAHNATLSFAGDKLLLVEHNRSRHTSSRVIALNATEGNFLWESPVPPNLGQSYFFGDNLLYHDGRGKMVALNLADGSRLWERKLGEAHIVNPYWDGQHLHIFHASLWHGPHHLRLDPKSGATTDRQGVVVTHARNEPNHGKAIENGWYEVTFPPTSARFVRLTTLSDIAGRGWASAAELHVLDAKGKRISRKNWLVEAEHERHAAPRALPRNVIDGDHSTWWHSQWIGDVPPHPHHVMLDLRKEQVITGFQYLPAKIINNNGMIRDYEWHVRRDKEDWGHASAKGILVNRLRVERAFFGPKAVFFEARNYPDNNRAVFRYTFGGGPAERVEKDGQLLSMHGPYAVIRTRVDNKDSLVLRRSDQPDYRFPLTPHIDPNRHQDLVISGDHLISGRHKVSIADLQSRRFLDLPKADNPPYHRQGSFLRLGKEHFLKIVHHNNQQALALFNMKTGAVKESVIDSQFERFREDRFLRAPDQSLLVFDRTLLFYDNSILSAWVAAN